MTDENAVTRAGDMSRSEILQAIERPVPRPCPEHRWRTVSFDVLTRREVQRCLVCGELETES